MVTTTVAAVCSYFAQQYSGIKQQYSMEEILQWGVSIFGWAPTVMMLISKQVYQGLTPKEEVKKPNSNSVRSILLFLAMLIVCVIHGVLLLSYPPANWKDMSRIIAVGLVIGAVYNQVAVPKLDFFLNGPSFEHPVSEELKLIDSNI
jgi:predicted ferric reductase